MSRQKDTLSDTGKWRCFKIKKTLISLFVIFIGSLHAENDEKINWIYNIIYTSNGNSICIGEVYWPNGEYMPSPTVCPAIPDPSANDEPKVKCPSAKDCAEDKSGTFNHMHQNYEFFEQLDNLVQTRNYITIEPKSSN